MVTSNNKKLNLLKSMKPNQKAGALAHHSRSRSMLLALGFMIAQKLVSMLLNEATVRLPPRSSRWVGVFRGAEPGQQIARSTGLTDKTQALALIRRWEADSIRK